MSTLLGVLDAFVKLPWVDPGVWRFFFQDDVGNYLHTFVLEKENAKHRGPPGEANRTHPQLRFLWLSATRSSGRVPLLEKLCKTRPIIPSGASSCMWSKIRIRPLIVCSHCRSRQSGQGVPSRENVHLRFCPTWEMNTLWRRMVLLEVDCVHSSPEPFLTMCYIINLSSSLITK